MIGARSLTVRLAALSVLLLTACSSLRVTSDQYAGAGFAGYRSYAWIADDPLIHPAGGAVPVSALTVRRIREAIDAELRAKGYKAIESANGADFVVAFSVGTRDRMEPQSFPLPYQGPWLWHSYAEGTELREGTQLRVYEEGELTINIFDQATHQPVWYGRASKEVTRSDSADPGPVIRQAVAAILSRFPSR